MTSVFPICFTPQGWGEQIGTKSVWLLSSRRRPVLLSCVCLMSCSRVCFSLSWLHKVNTLINKASSRFSFRGIFGSQDIATKGNSALWRHCRYFGDGDRDFTFLPYFFCCSSVGGIFARGQTRDGLELGN